MRPEASETGLLRVQIKFRFDPNSTKSPHLQCGIAVTEKSDPCADPPRGSIGKPSINETQSVRAAIFIVSSPDNQRRKAERTLNVAFVSYSMRPVDEIGKYFHSLEDLAISDSMT